MANLTTLWSLDLGRSSLKAVRMRRDRNNVEILDVEQIEYEVSSDGVNFSEQAREAISAFKSLHDVRDPVVVAHHGQGTLSRFIKIPAFDPKKIKEMVGYEASQQIPFPLDEVIWDYHLVDGEYMPGEERDVGIFAARRDAIEDFLVDFQSEGLSVESLTIGYLGLVNFILFDIAPEEPTIFVDIGASHTDLILVEGRRFWTRALPHSGNEINSAIMEHFRLNFSEAEKLKRESAKNPQQAVKIFTAVIRPRLRELIGEIHRSIGYYRSQSGEVQFKQLYLLGNGSKVMGIKKLMEQHLGVAVERVDSIARLRINREANLQVLQDSLPGFGTAFGAGLQGLGLGSCRVDLLPQEEKVLKAVTRKKKHVFIALAIAYVLVLLAGLIVQGKIGKATESYDSLTKFHKPIKTQDRAIKKLEVDDITKDAEDLQAVGRLRLKPFDALTAVSSVLSLLSNDETEELVRAAQDEAAVIGPLRIQLYEELNKRAWVPWIRITKAEYPEIGKATKKKKGKKAKRRKKGDEGPVSVPAYKVTLMAAVKQQENNTASLNLLKELVVKRLENKLKGHPNWTLDSNIQISTETQVINRLIKARADDLRGQEGGPFFAKDIHWFMRLEDPPKPAPEDDGDSDPGEK
jgi:type IV pilus assembly protein PilM